MAEAVLRSGAVETVDYTPGANIALGQVVVPTAVTANTTGVGWTLGIAQRPITNAALGALAVSGIWGVTAAGNYALGVPLYWDDSANKVTSTSTNNSFFGGLVDRGTAGTSGDTSNTTVYMALRPFIRS